MIGANCPIDRIITLCFSVVSMMNVKVFVGSYCNCGLFFCADFKIKVKMKKVAATAGS